MSASVKPSRSYIGIITFQRWVTITSIIMAGVSLAYSAYIVQQERANGSTKAFFISNNGGGMGEQVMFSNDNVLKLEIKSQIKIFANCMWNFDQNNYWDQVQRGVDLSSEPGKRIYKTYKEASFYDQLKAYDARSILYVDNVEILEISQEPYKARLNARYGFKTGEKEVIRNLIAYVELRQVSRSEQNVHGLLVTTFNIENNAIISE